MRHDSRNRQDACSPNRDPITESPGSHPLGTGLGGSAGAVGGAVVGAMFGPIGMLVGGALGTLAGAVAGHGTAEMLDPTCEEDYWREHHRDRPYAKPGFNYEQDYVPAYHYGSEQRRERGERTWDSELERELEGGWNAARGASRMDWPEARDVVRDGWVRADRTYRAYSDTDAFYESRWRDEPFSDADDKHDFEDFRTAYRFGTYARHARPARDWDDSLDRELEAEWPRSRGRSTLGWDKARPAVRDAWQRADQQISAQHAGDAAGSREDHAGMRH